MPVTSLSWAPTVFQGRLWEMLGCSSVEAASVCLDRPAPQARNWYGRRSPYLRGAPSGTASGRRPSVWVTLATQWWIRPQLRARRYGHGVWAPGSKPRRTGTTQLMLRGKITILSGRFMILDLWRKKRNAWEKKTRNDLQRGWFEWREFVFFLACKPQIEQHQLSASLGPLREGWTWAKRKQNQYSRQFPFGHNGDIAKNGFVAVRDAEIA